MPTIVPMKQRRKAGAFTNGQLLAGQWGLDTANSVWYYSVDGATVAALVTTADVAALTHAATSKATPVDADELPLADSAASFTLKKLTWANLKATAKTYFDTLYQALNANLTALAALAATGGMLARTGAGAFAVRTITGTANQVTVTNGDGVAANPTLSLPQSIAAISIPQFAAVGLNTSTPTVLNGTTLTNIKLQAFNNTNSAYLAVSTNLAGGYAGVMLNRSAANADERLWAFEAVPFSSNTSSAFGVSRYTDAGTPTTVFTITRTSNVVCGAWAVLATTATEGFLHIPSMAGTPTGVPALFPGKVPMVADTTGSKLWLYIGGAWKSATLT